VRVTILNDIVHADFETSLDIQKSWGIELLDLRGSIYGKSFLDLTDGEMSRATAAIEERGLSTYCLSSGLFFDLLDKGEAHFREAHLGRVDDLIRAADAFRPRVVRLLSARFSARADVSNSIPYVTETFPWMFPLYREAVERLHEAGHRVTIENEVNGCILSTPDEILDYFRELDAGAKASFTFDAQNLWKEGTFPTMDVYRRLAPLIGYYHLKGGRADEGGRALKWSTSLEDASWPVEEMTNALVRDGCAEAICLNPSHGDLLEGYDYSDMNRRNVTFLRQRIAGIH